MLHRHLGGVAFSSVVWLAALSCGGGAASTSSGPGGTGGQGGAAPATGGSGGTSPEPFAAGALTCEPAPPDPLDASAACCDAGVLRPIPGFAKTVLDLSDPAGIARGTCATYPKASWPDQALLLPLDPEAYPLKIILPASSAPDPACQTTCPDDGGGKPHTAFGVAFYTKTEAKSLIGGNSGRVLAISVPPPWYFVSGGCGEACAWPCLEGYQEFGVRSCITMAYGDGFGFATSDPNAPSVEAVVEVIEVGEAAFSYAPGGCCLFSSSG